jgi:hypothetical protein
MTDHSTILRQEPLTHRVRMTMGHEGNVEKERVYALILVVVIFEVVA